MKNIRLYSIIMLSIFCSCNKILDVKPQDIINPDTYYNTEEQLRTALRGVYATLADGSLYGNHLLGRMGLDADEGYENYTTDQQGVGYYVVSAADTKILSYWRALYAGINRANLLLANIDKPKMEQVERDNIKGQALFLRAYFYFMLVNKFGDVPLILQMAPSASAEDVQVPRSPASTVYHQIITDMEEAGELVLDAAAYSGGGHVSKSAVWGILSRVCLYAAGHPLNELELYEKAAHYAGKVIDLGIHALNPSYQQVFINYARDIYDIKESIWEVEFWGNNTTSYINVAGMVGRNIGVRNSSTIDNIGYAIGVLKATPALFNLYDDMYVVKGRDLRRGLNIVNYFYRQNTVNPSQTDVVNTGGGFDSYCAKFRREYETLLPKNSVATPQNYPLLRYSDVLLMYAEAVNQKSSKTVDEIETAYKCINQVRKRGYGVIDDDTWDIAQADFPLGSELLEFIQNERARELCFESLRKNDLVRWGIFYPQMKYIESLVPANPSATLAVAKTVYANVNPFHVSWPIPTYELGINNKLTQNSGW